MTIQTLNSERLKNIMRHVAEIANVKLTKFFASIKMIKVKMSFKSKH